jgi:hypothetical protein
MVVARHRVRDDQSTYDLAWPRQVAVSPTAIRHYTNCPHRIRLQYIEKRKSPYVYNLFLDQGNIAHTLLAEVAHRRRNNTAQRSEDEMWHRAFRRLPQHEFPSRAAHESAANEVIAWVRYGTGYLDREARILVVEKPEKRLWTWPGGSVLTITTRPDAILLRTDADGEQYVEIIDYKTGSKDYVDDVPPVTMRYVFKKLFHDISADTLSIRMQFSYVWLAHREAHTIALTPEYCESQWEQVTGVIDQLLTEREWLPQPSHLCHYCPFNGHHCDAFAAWHEDDASDW